MLNYIDLLESGLLKEGLKEIIPENSVILEDIDFFVSEVEKVLMEKRTLDIKYNNKNFDVKDIKEETIKNFDINKFQEFINYLTYLVIQNILNKKEKQKEEKQKRLKEQEQKKQEMINYIDKEILKYFKKNAKNFSNKPKDIEKEDFFNLIKDLDLDGMLYLMKKTIDPKLKFSEKITSLDLKKYLFAEVLFEKSKEYYFVKIIFSRLGLPYSLEEFKNNEKEIMKKGEKMVLSKK